MDRDPCAYDYLEGSGLFRQPSMYLEDSEPKVSLLFVLYHHQAMCGIWVLVVEAVPWRGLHPPQAHF